MLEAFGKKISDLANNVPPPAKLRIKNTEAKTCFGQRKDRITQYL
jgi:hypothetical protein